jgi:hypothetical protein
MREVNFSIPSANKASVGITPQLYDRRALDTTSTLPLINSLNNLAYLTTSSARIRDILTVDGGVERLVCILKGGRNSKDMMECWKWNLAFQCVVNIGVRGSENVRTRVVEADMVPVIATVLNNYIRVIDKFQTKNDAEMKRTLREHAHDHLAEFGPDDVDDRPRQRPPPIEIPSGRENAPGRRAVPPGPLSNPPERSTFVRSHHHHHRSLESRTPGMPPMRSAAARPLLTSVPLIDTAQDNLRPVRDIDRLPSMVPVLQAEFAAPESPTTPGGVAQLPGALRRSPTRTTRRPSIRHQLSISNQSELGPVDDPAEGSADANPPVEIQNDISMQDLDVSLDGESPLRMDAPAPQVQDVDTLNLARSVLESSIANNNQAANDTAEPNTAVPPPMHLTYGRYLQERSQTTSAIPSMPRDEDVLMCLQLLAYVSKYCYLRSYFQQSHLVPRLNIPDAELSMIDGERSPTPMEEDDELAMEEYLQPDDFNIFPLVEKFTVRHHSHDMQYWARVVMRNLCRKDDSKGGIRQCAYYKCGKWEQFTREFAKCRRCRRTKYCSKDCQKMAWVFHRHWCVEAQQ